MNPHPFKIERWSSQHCYVTGPALYCRELCQALRDARLMVRATAGAIEVDGPMSLVEKVLGAFIRRRGIRT